MAEYSKVNVKVSDSQLKKLKSAVKNQTGVTLRITMDMFKGNNLPHELLLTTKQKAKLKNAFENNMPTDIKSSKTHISKIIPFRGFLGTPLSKIADRLMKVAVLLAKTFSSIVSSNSNISNRCRNSKENRWFWNNNSTNFK